MDEIKLKRIGFDALWKKFVKRDLAIRAAIKTLTPNPALGILPPTPVREALAILRNAIDD